MSWASYKALARRAVHTAFCVSAVYKDPDGVVSAEALKVRWHMRQTLAGQLDNGGYAEVVEGIEKIIFDKDELQALALTPERNGTITLMAPEYRLIDGSQPEFVLQYQDEDTGPVEESWQVTRVES